MYSFSRKAIGPYVIHISVQKAGDVHRKKFVSGVTPSNQNTTNIYVKGKFLFSIGEHSQELTAGQTSLDLQIAEYPANVIATETVLSDYAVRYCVPSKDLSKTIVQVGENQTHTLEENSLVFVLSGKAVVNNTNIGPGGYWLVRNIKTVTGPVKLLMLNSKVL